MPPTTVTTAGYWGSTYWSKGYWGADYWKQRVPVPVPPSPGGGGGTSLSGGMRWAGYRQTICFHKPIGFIEDKILKTSILNICRPHPEEKLDKKKTREISRKYEIGVLKKKVRDLEMELTRIRLEGLQGTADVAAFKVQVKQLLGRISELETELINERETSSPIVRGLPWIAASVVTGLATAMLIPTSSTLLRWIGWSGTTVLAAIGIGSALTPPAPPSKPASMERVGLLLPIGVIRR
jgi:hypothetical protein